MKTVLTMFFSILLISFAMLNINSRNLSTSVSQVGISSNDDLHTFGNEHKNYTLAKYTDENLERAKNIYDNIMSNKKLNNAYIIVNNNYAIIGIDSNSDLKNAELAEIEKNILNVDDNIENVILVEDDNIVEDLKLRANYGVI